MALMLGYDGGMSEAEPAESIVAQGPAQQLAGLADFLIEKGIDARIQPAPGSNANS